jgi:hypothetical protein
MSEPSKDEQPIPWRDRPPSVSRGFVLGHVVGLPPFAVFLGGSGHLAWAGLASVLWLFVMFMWLVRGTLHGGEVRRG